MDDALFADGIDGIHGLRRRERTRLWYRSFQESDFQFTAQQVQAEQAIDEIVESADATEDDYSQDAIDAFLSEWVADAEAVRTETPAAISGEERQERILRRLGEFHQIKPVAVDEPIPAKRSIERIAITGWRNVPRNAPMLMLSNSSMLDSKTAGPILGPGSRYRVLSAEDGIVELQIDTPEGDLETGFCNAVDMTCIDPMIVHLAGGRKISTKQRLSKIGRGISHVTGSLMSFSS